MISMNMPRVSLAWGLMLLTAGYVQGQNLIPNYSFEEKTTSDCVEPWEGFQHLEHWYESGPTPDLFEQGCLISQQGWSFWDEDLPAYHQSIYGGLACAFQYNGVFLPEGVGVQLLEPLEGGRLYFIDLQVRPKGVFFHRRR